MLKVEEPGCSAPARERIQSRRGGRLRQIGGVYAGK